jgi:hypothetical protein
MLTEERWRKSVEMAELFADNQVAPLKCKTLPFQRLNGLGKLMTTHIGMQRLRRLVLRTGMTPD